MGLEDQNSDSGTQQVSMSVREQRLLDLRNSLDKREERLRQAEELFNSKADSVRLLQSKLAKAEMNRDILKETLDGIEKATLARAQIEDAAESLKVVLCKFEALADSVHIPKDWRKQQLILLVQAVSSGVFSECWDSYIENICEYYVEERRDDW